MDYLMEKEKKILIDYSHVKKELIDFKYDSECNICYFKYDNIYKFCNHCEIYYCFFCIVKLINLNKITCIICKKMSLLHYKIYYRNILKDIYNEYKNSLYKFLEDKKKFGSKRKISLFEKVDIENDTLLINKKLYKYNLKELTIFKKLMITDNNENNKKKNSFVINDYLLNVFNYLINDRKI